MADDADDDAPSAAAAPSPAVTRNRGRRTSKWRADHSLTTNKYDATYEADAIRRRVQNSPKKRRCVATARGRPAGTAAAALAFDADEDDGVADVDGADAKEYIADDTAESNAVEGARGDDNDDSDDDDSDADDNLVNALLAEIDAEGEPGDDALDDAEPGGTAIGSIA
jgi:hypothetical protein